MRIRFFLHALRFFLAQATGRGNGDLLFLVGRVVLCRHIQDAVGVNVECDVNLRHTARRWWNSNEMEFPERTVSAGNGTLSLQHVNLYGSLIIRSRRERLRLARRDRRVTRDQHGRDTAQRFDTQRKWRHVEQQNVLNFAAQHTALNRGAHRDNFVRIDTLVRLFTVEQSLYDVNHARDSSGTANENYFVDFIRREACITQCLLYRSYRALQQVFHQLFELRTGEFQLQVLRSRRVRSDERQIDFRLH